MLKFSLVTTVFNEKQRLGQTIDDIQNQTVQPDEIIITDAGSTDGTFNILLDWAKSSKTKIIVLQENKCNVARGRNLAIQAASNEIIVSTDFGCRFHPNWLETLTKPFKSNEVKVVGGGYTVLEEELKSRSARAAYLLAYGYKINFDKWFIPSSRSIAYYKHVWEDVGKYPEWLTLAGDDYFFGLAISENGYDIHVQKEPLVFWGRHEDGVGYEKEAFRYGLGNGEAKINFKSVLVILAEWLFRIAGAVTLILTFIWQELYEIWLLLTFCFWTLGFRSYIGIARFWFHNRSAKYSFNLLLSAYVLLEKTRFQYLKGFYKGYTSRITK